MKESIHASISTEGINAKEKCIAFINNLKTYYRFLEEEKIETKSATMNIGMINGGRSSNIVPDTCEIGKTIH